MLKNGKIQSFIFELIPKNVKNGGQEQNVKSFVQSTPDNSNPR